MKELYVIVHEGAVREHVKRGNQRAQRTLENIEAIKSQNSFVNIPDHEIPEKLSLDMPLPSIGLRVLVCGAFLDDCCSYQLFHLKEAGYNAAFHPTACLKGEASPPKTLLKKINEKYPEFYEGYY